jgi:hypothetical protein
LHKRVQSGYSSRLDSERYLSSIARPAKRFCGSGFSEPPKGGRTV